MIKKDDFIIMSTVYICKQIFIVYSLSLIPREQKDLQTVYRCHVSIGSLYSNKGRPASALRSYEEAKRIAKKLQKPLMEADALTSMGMVKWPLQPCSIYPYIRIYIERERERYTHHSYFSLVRPNIEVYG